jgi:RNA polymerase sigma-70 factor (ECF subfamily)
LAGHLNRVALGDLDAFAAVYDKVSAPVLGVIRRVVRDPAQSEEVTQEVLLEVWRAASRFDPRQGSAMGWVLTIAHRRAVDRVRSATRSAVREAKVVDNSANPDEVAETVEIVLEHERVRRCLASLTELQRQSVLLAFYGGYTYAQVAELLNLPIGTVKTRLRDGLIRLRDCLGVQT